MGDISLILHISYNLSGFLLTVIVCYVFGQFFDSFNVIASPLSATKLFAVTLCVFQLGASNFLQKVQRPKISTFLRGLAVLLLSTCLFHSVAVLYGAPLSESVEDTFHLSFLLTTVTVLPALLYLGLSGDTWIRVFLHNRPELGVESCTRVTTWCGLVGAWLGAFPIPLDWDRPWQEWPVSCVIGTLCGYCVGLVLASVHLVVQHRRRQKMKLV